MTNSNIIKKKRLTGFNELAEVKMNITKYGCEYLCRYCFNLSLCVFGRGFDPADLDVTVIDREKLNALIDREGDTVIYPNTHDITPKHLESHLLFIGKLLAVYPKVTVISKPNLVCIRAICEAFPEQKDKLTFLFTIGTVDDKNREFWEPHAPSIPERVECLKLAHELGFKTSVISEPLLDETPDGILDLVKPYVSDVIWIGKGKMMAQRVSCNGHKDPESKARVKQLEAWHSKAKLEVIYQRLKDDPQIRWKETIQKILGLQLPK